MKPLPRNSKTQYAMDMAAVAAKRSEDPYQQVGCIALTRDTRIIATAYNGLLPGYVPAEGFWDDRDKRGLFMIHAEVNLCSLFKRGEACTVVTTLCPCTGCLLMLAAHGIEHIIYRDEYGRDGHNALEVAKFYSLNLVKFDGK
jgi:dCMP deaminase